MADDDIDDEEFDENLDVDDEAILDDDEPILDDAEVADDDADVPAAAEDEEDEAVAVEAAPKSRKKRDEDEDDDDEADPDDVEADLDKILKDRIAANEDDDEDEELEEAAPRAAGETPDGVQPKKANEFMCTGCFLLVNAAQFGPPGHLECPVGEAVCPAMKLVEKHYQKAKK
jgi:hypothetical protein